MSGLRQIKNRRRPDKNVWPTQKRMPGGGQTRMSDLPYGVGEHGHEVTAENVVLCVLHVGIGDIPVHTLVLIEEVGDCDLQFSPLVFEEFPAEADIPQHEVLVEVSCQAVIESVVHFIPEDNSIQENQVQFHARGVIVIIVIQTRLKSIAGNVEVSGVRQS